MYEITEDTVKLDRSPCLTCERKDKDKSRCAPICKPLDAFRRGHDYSGLPIPEKVDIEKRGRPELSPVLCTKCKKRPGSKDDGLCTRCRQAMKSKAAKKKKAA